MKSVAGTATNPTSSNIMLVTNELAILPVGGRELLGRLNHDVLKEIYGDAFTSVQIARKPIQGLASIAKSFRGYIDGLTREVIAESLLRIRMKKVDTVFVDGSNFGQWVKVIKKTFPDVRVCTFFHNVEAIFFLGALRQYKSPRALAVLTANYFAEAKSVKYSDKIICLSERDARLLRLLYGRAATHVSPIALRDRFPAEGAISNMGEGIGKEKFGLFVGSAFFANRAGITWFVKNVAPRIAIKICIIGRGFDEFADELNLEGKVAVVGEVENLPDWYLKAHFVIAPIFDGSGMKTKVAEALMFGKKIVGTPEAFSGYEDVVSLAGWVCKSADDFVAAIEEMDTFVQTPFASDLRSAYEDKYSYAAAKSRLERILLEDVSEKRRVIEVDNMIGG